MFTTFIMLDFMVPLNDGRKVVCLGFEIIHKLGSYFLMTVRYIILTLIKPVLIVVNYVVRVPILSFRTVFQTDE